MGKKEDLAMSLSRASSKPLKKNREILEGALVFAISQPSKGMKDVEDLERMGVDVVVRGISVGWRASPQTMRKRSKAVKRIFEEAKRRGILWSAMITGSAIYPDILPEGDISLYASRDAHGRVIPTRGWYQGCLSNPKFREFVKRVARAAIEAGISAIHYDEAYSRWFWRKPLPCFCDHCIRLFREWLKREVSPEKLRKLGIESLDNFDYRQYLADRGLADKPWRSPLHDEYWRFLLYSTIEFEREIVRDARRFCQEKLGEDFVANSNQYDMAHLSAVLVAESLIYDFKNIGTGTGRLPPHETLIPQHLMASACVPEKKAVTFLDLQRPSLPPEAEGQLFRWFAAEAYASGAFFALHHRFSLWEGPVGQLARIGRFVKGNPHLFRGTLPLANVGVVFSFASQIWDMYPLHWEHALSLPCHSRVYYEACKALLLSAFQFEALFLGEGRLFPADLAMAQAGRLREIPVEVYKAIILPETYALSDENLELLRRYALSGGTLVLLGECGSLDERRRGRRVDPFSDLARKGRAIRLEKQGFRKALPSVLGQKVGVKPIALPLDPPLPVDSRVGPVFLLTRRDSTGRRLLLHVINQAFRKGQGFRPLPKLKVALRVAGKFSGARAFSPDWEEGSRPKEVEARPLGKGWWALTLPPFEVWEVVEVMKG